MSQLNRHFARLFTAAILIATGIFFAGFMKSESIAGVRTPPERTAFKSGSARSEAILREIADTLKRIDARIERLEKSQAAQLKKR